MDNNADDTFAGDLENRLDNFFEGSPPPENPTPEFAEEKPVPEAGDILKDLKSTVLAIDWEITDDVLNDFIHQIDTLMDPFKEDKTNRTLLKLLRSLGRYLLAHKSMAHPDTIKRIMAVYSAIEESVSNDSLSETDREMLLVDEIKQFRQLKEQISKSSTTHPAQKSRNPSSSEKAPGIEAVIKAIDDLRSLMASELSAIRNEIGQLRKK